MSAGAESNWEIANQAARRARREDRIVYASLIAIMLIVVLLILLFRSIASRRAEGLFPHTMPERLLLQSFKSFEFSQKNCNNNPTVRILMRKHSVPV